MNASESMHTIELLLPVPDDAQEFLIAELMDLDFEGFLQEDDVLYAYISAPRWDDVKRERIEQWLRARGIAAPVEERAVTAQNWNQQWEETIRPLAVGPFVIKPTWADLPAEHADKMLLEIDPKMSFGTGYHETTRLMLRHLPGLVHGGERVLDAGTGTGVLAIAALKLGADSAIAFDIDAWAQQNAVENFYLNGVAEHITFREGDISVVPETGFDLILANINQHVILDLLPAFAEKLKPDGRIALAGMLRYEPSALLGPAGEHGFELIEEAIEGEWLSVVLRFAQKNPRSE